MARLTRNLDDDRWAEAKPRKDAPALTNDFCGNAGEAGAAGEASDRGGATLPGWCSTDRGTRGWLAYDDTCPMCRRMTARFSATLARRGISLAPLSTPWVRARLGLKPGERADRMWLILPDGRQFGGADAAIEIGKQIVWAWPFAIIAGLPGIRWLLQRLYLAIAKRRACDANGCATPSPS